jgi:arsenate reductase
MAQAIWENAGNSEWVAFSAGSRPSGYVHPLALKSIEELGLSIGGLESKSVDLFLGEEIDLAVTVCDHAKEACPVLPGVGCTLHWPFEDPAEVTGTDDEKMIQFRKIRDQIKDKIESFLTREEDGC